MERQHIWGDMSKDDVVKVSGTDRSKWRFVAFCTNIITGAEWIDVYGGPSGYQTIRSFKPERVSAVPIKKPRARRVA